MAQARGRERDREREREREMAEELPASLHSPEALDAITGYYEAYYKNLWEVGYCRGFEDGKKAEEERLPAGYPFGCEFIWKKGWEFGFLMGKKYMIQLRSVARKKKKEPKERMKQAMKAMKARKAMKAMKAKKHK